LIVGARWAGDGRVVRSAVPEDARAVERLYGQLVPTASGVSVRSERLAQISDDPNSVLLVVDDNGLVAGTAFLTLSLDPMFGHQPFAVIENVVVDQERRGSGCGRALLLELARIAVQTDCSKVMLLSDQSRGAAHTFFAKMGYSASIKHGFVRYRRELP
jgi:N-acetylglutamate synthase-like GNAT family acetyltransferase